MPEASDRDLPPIDPVNRGLYMTIILVLGVAALGALAIWGYTVIQNKAMPDGLSNLLSAIVGGFLGALVPAAASRK